MARLGNLPKLVNRLIYVRSVVFSVRMIEREPANELAFKGVSDVAGAGDVFFEILDR